MPKREISREEAYEISSPLGRAQWHYQGFMQKLRDRDIQKTYPKDPVCKKCRDDGIVWQQLKAGKSIRVKCDCQLGMVV